MKENQSPFRNMKTSCEDWLEVGPELKSIPQI